jgi:replicative DNA helicase
LIELTQKIATSAHIEKHARLLQQFYIKRQLINDASMMLATAYDNDKDSLELLNEWSESLDHLNEQISMAGAPKNAQSYHRRPCQW